MILLIQIKIKGIKNKKCSAEGFFNDIGLDFINSCY